MAITRVQSAVANSGASSVSAQILTWSTAPVEGNILVVVGSGLGSASIPGCTATFSQTGVEWVLMNITASGANSTLLFMAVGRVYASAGTQLTVTTLSAGGMALVGAEYSGVDFKCDKFKSATGSGTSPASGNTATTSRPVQLWVGGIAHRATNGGTFSAPSNSFTIVDQTKTNLGSTSDRSAALLERLVTSTGTPNAACTVSPTGVWVAAALSIEVPVESVSVSIG